MLICDLKNDLMAGGRRKTEEEIEGMGGVEH